MVRSSLVNCDIFKEATMINSCIHSPYSKVTLTDTSDGRDLNFRTGNNYAVGESLKTPTVIKSINNLLIHRSDYAVHLP